MLPPTESPAIGEAARVEAFGGAFVGDPLRDRVALLERNGVAGFRRAVVFGEDDGGPDADGELADESVVRVRVAHDPATAMDVEEDRQRSGRAGRPDDARRHFAGRTAGDGDPFLVDGGLCDVAHLHVVEGFAALGEGQLEQKRWIGGRLGERQRGRLERGRVGCGCGHGCLLWWFRRVELTGRGSSRGPFRWRRGRREATPWRRPQPRSPAQSACGSRSRGS